jgi:hypothetical protein
MGKSELVNLNGDFYAVVREISHIDGYAKSDNAERGAE